MHSDVLVVGGGPAGLAAAIASRLQGLRVTLVDSRRPPIDKPCGEGLLPEAVSALRSFGIDVNAAPCFRFSGIRFVDSGSSVFAQFGAVSACGVRRTVLHKLLADRARALGVSLRWGSRLTNQRAHHAEVDGQRISFRWLVAADGLNSGIRRQAGLDPLWPRRGRFAFRRHYAIAPWTDLVEVHWGDTCQIIATPTGTDEVCLALFSADHHLRIADALPLFPALAKHFAGAQPTSSESGARTVLSVARAAFRGNIAFIGDASCSIDGIAGQGLSLALQSAQHLARALTRENLREYAAAHRAITRTPVDITRLMLLMARYPWIRKKALRMFAAKPALFSDMMSIHAGTAAADTLALHEIFTLGWRVLCA